MAYNVESAIIELETLTPLFIKGKDVNYGEGFLKVDDTLYSVNNDELCKFIYESTFDETGNKKLSYDYVEWYEKYFARGNSFDNSQVFGNFCNTFGLNYNEKVNRDRDTKEFSLFKEMSLQFFLENVGLLKGSIEQKKEIAKNIAKGITYISDGNKFVQNGNGKHFIPGSSIKGAIRNAVLWKILSDATKNTWLNGFVTYNLTAASRLRDSDKKKYKEHFSKQPNNLDEKVDTKSFTEIKPNKIIPKNATSEEQTYLGEFNQRWQSANETLRDFFRIVKISDANFDGNVILKNEKARAVCKDANGTPPNNQSYQKKFDINLQCAPAKTKARFKISIDLQLASEFFPTGVPFYLQSVLNLLKTVDEFFRAVADFEEKDFYLGLTTIPNDVNPNDKRTAKLKVYTNQIYSLYQNRFGLTPESVLFRTGWGGGFMSKTQFLHLTMPQRVRIRDLVRHNGSPIAPKSRCLIVEGQNAIAPLGWCKITILPNGELPDINQAKIAVTNTPLPDGNEKRENTSFHRGGFQPKPATEKEIAQSKAEANKILKHAEKSKPRIVSYKKGDKIEMKVIKTVNYKPTTLEYEGNSLFVETNKMKREGEIVAVEILEVKDGKITKVKIL
ncbi:MAG: type III-A CRISPR-associated RAMP protein Csm5 [Chloroherpetonaceae bacterium]|nr:type III-A CRISPR-associated RAMP protein Csm5 [Chloroherpetonaceae bacterium]